MCLLKGWKLRLKHARYKCDSEVSELCLNSTSVCLQHKLLAVFDTKPQCSCFDLSHSGQRGASLTAPFQIAFLGQSLFLFSPVCGQCHSEASGPKVSWSIILILHSEQTGCMLSKMYRRYLNIKLLSCGNKKNVRIWRKQTLWLLNPCL